MASPDSLHPTTLRILGFEDRTIPVAGDIRLQVEVSCSAGCDLRGAVLSVVAMGETLANPVLRVHDKLGHKTEEFSLRAPAQVGEHTWMITLPRGEGEDVIHDECAIPLIFTTRPHGASLAIWDVPSPVVVEGRFTVKVGVKCAANCKLAGRLVDVRDESGEQVGHGRLNEDTWQETSALYWAEVQLTAPSTEQVTSWRAIFRVDGSGLPHEEAAATFGFRSVRRPDHRVTVNLVDANTQRPLSDAEVRLGIYATVTDTGGVASFDVPAGTYDLTIRKDGYEAAPSTLEVSADVTARVDAAAGVTRAAWEDKLQEFKHIPWG